MFKELDIKAYNLYTNSIILGNNFYCGFNLFYKFKENYEQYYIEALTILRKEKLNKICTAM